MGRSKARKEAVAEVAARRATTFQSNVAYEDILQEVLDVRVAEFRFAQSKVDEITDANAWRDTVAGKIPNEWIVLRDEYAAQLAKLSKDIIAIGLAHRQVRIAEAQVELIALALQTAMAQAGVDAATIKLVGHHFRIELEKAQTEVLDAKLLAA